MAGVLRRENLTSAPAFSFADVEAKAAQILRDANDQAQRLLADASATARQRAQQIEQEAKAEGFKKGCQDGQQEALVQGRQVAIDEARQSLNQLGQSIGTAIARFEEAKRRLVAQAETGVIKLAIEIARRVCKHDAGQSSAAAIDNARHLLEMVKHEADLELCLNPADAITLREVLPDVLAAAGHGSHADIIEDAAVPRGGVQLRSRSGSVDATLETQLERVAAALLPGPVDSD